MKRLIVVVVGVICLVCGLAGCTKCPGLNAVDPVTGEAMSCYQCGPLYWLKAGGDKGGVFHVGFQWGEQDK